MKYLCPSAVLAISHPCGSGVSPSSSRSPRLCCLKWAGAALTGGAGDRALSVCGSMAGDERDRPWTICSPPGPTEESELPSRLCCGFEGGVKNEAGSLRLAKGSPAGEAAPPPALLFCSTANSCSMSVAESCLTCRTCCGSPEGATLRGAGGGAGCCCCCCMFGACCCDMILRLDSPEKPKCHELEKISLCRSVRDV